jgi:hypothetical protein
MKMSHQLHAPVALQPGKEAFGTYWIGGWVDPRAGLDAVEKRKTLALARKHTLTFQPVASRYID